MSIVDSAALEIADLLGFMRDITAKPVVTVLTAIIERLEQTRAIGLDYLSLRPRDGQPVQR